MVINNFEMTHTQRSLIEEASHYYFSKVYDEEDILEDLKIVNFIKRFFNKLHDNKLINVQLLVNHEIILYNTFEKDWITNYQLKIIAPEHHTYFKTILLYLNLINLNDARFVNIPFSFDLDYLLQTKANKPSFI